MRLAVVTNYPPDRRPLSEYGFHLVNALRRSNASAEVIVVAGGLRATHRTDGTYRSWGYGTPFVCLQIAAALRRLRADAAIINTHFTMWGSGVANFSGLLTPWVLSRLGTPTITILHHTPLTIDIKRIGYRFGLLHRLAVNVVYRALATSGTLCFIAQRDRDEFHRLFPSSRAIRVFHGTLGDAQWSVPDTTARGVLAFGNWGRGKDPEPLIRPFTETSIGHLTIAGGSSHTAPGFLERLQARYNHPDVAFVGYVPEESVPGLFKSSCLVVLPYKENTGYSGVLLQACQYGRAVLARRLPMFEAMARELRLRISFYDEDARLGETVSSLLSHPDALVAGGRHNFEQVRSHTLEGVAETYWRLVSLGTL